VTCSRARGGGAGRWREAPVSAIATHIGALTGWRRAGAAAAAGALSVLALAPFFATPVLFLTFPILVWLIDGCQAENRQWTAGRAALTGWAFGFGYFLAGLYWVGAAFLVEAERFGWLLPFAVALLPAGLALFYAGAAAFASCLWRPGAARLVALAIAFMAGEIARGHLLTGFPWNAVGYALATDHTMLQASSVLGAYGLTPLAVLIFSSPASIWAPEPMRSKSWRARLALPAAALVLLAAAAAWGAWRLGAAAPGNVAGVRLRLVQPNIPQKEKWLMSNRVNVFRTLMRLSAGGDGRAPGGLAGISHLIWPESSVPFLLADTPEALAMLAEMLPPNTTFIIGAARGDGDYGGARERQIYNSILLMDGEARILDTYDKVRLVPFGEFLPFQGLLEAIGLEQLTRLRGGFAAGTAHALMHPPGAPPFSPLICYEIIFPHWVRGEDGTPGWLLNLTNDAWFGDSSGPYQHFHQARVRAVEQGLPVMRVANSGISGVIDPYGRVTARLDLNTQGVLDADLPAAIAPTPFAKWGGAIEAAMLIALGLVWLALAGGTPRRGRIGR